MATEVKKFYEAKDGSEHPTKKAAENRNQLVDAEYELRCQVEKVGRLIGKAALTADGEPFEVSLWRDYWMVVNSYDGLPVLRQISMYGYAVAVDSCRNDQALTVVAYDRHAEKDKIQRFYVQDLYANRDKARAAHLAACEERIKHLTERVDGIRQDYEAR